MDILENPGLRGRAFVDTSKTKALEAEPSWTPWQALATPWKMGHHGANLDHLGAILGPYWAPFCCLGGQVGFSQTILEPFQTPMWPPDLILVRIWLDVTSMLLKNWFDLNPSKPLSIQVGTAECAELSAAPPGTSVLDTHVKFLLIICFLKF